MTIIAYRDGVLAADTQATQGESHRGASITKIAKRGTVLAAAAGAMPGALRFLDWFRSGMPGDTPDLGDDKNAAHGFIYTPGHPILRLTIHGWERYEAEYDAHGCGADYALGAMAMGATAEEAVRATLKHECLSGGEITVLRHQDSIIAPAGYDVCWANLDKARPGAIVRIRKTGSCNEVSERGWP